MRVRAYLFLYQVKNKQFADFNLFQLLDFYVYNFTTTAGLLTFFISAIYIYSVTLSLIFRFSIIPMYPFRTAKPNKLLHGYASAYTLDNFVPTFCGTVRNIKKI